MNSPGRAFCPPLLRRQVLRQAQRAPWQAWLNFLGIMLGVMMVVAVSLANGSARRSFELSMEAVNGSITHQILGGAEGVPDALFTRLRTELGLRASAPALSGRVRVNGLSLTLLGLDPLSEGALGRARPGIPASLNAPGAALLDLFTRRDAVVMSEEGAAAAGLAPGEMFTLLGPAGPVPARLAATFASANPAATEGLILADVAVAQRLLGRLGWLDSIDLVLDGETAETLRDWLPTGFALAETQGREDSLRRMTEAFHVNLLAMSLLSLLVAALLIYNTMTLAVVRRRPALGILRSLGVSRGELFTLVLGEAAVLGLAASLAGLLGGLLLGRFLVGLVTRTLDDLYFNLSVNRFLIEPGSLALGLALGLGATLLAAALPAWQAARAEPVSLRERALDAAAPRLRPFLLLGAALLAAGFFWLRRDSLVDGFIALTLMVFGFCFLVPGIMAGTLALLLRLRFPVTGRLALRGIRQGIGRTGLAVAALTVAVSVTVGVGVMVQSFRGTVIVWLEQSLGGDIQVGGERLPPDLAAALAALPAVEAVESTVMHEVETRAGPARLEASDAPAEGSFYLKEAGDAALAALARGEGILVSESFAWLASLGTGDRLEVHTPRGTAALPILGIVHDYTTGLGLLALSEPLYRRWWEDWPVNRLSLSLAPGAGASEALPAVRTVLRQAGGEYRATANADIRGVTLAIFDRTFAITNVLRLLAILVAFAGVLSALMALQLERLREYAVLRATGMTPGQIAALVLGQTLLLGLFAGLLSLPLGLLMSDVLIDVINRRSFGWSMQHLLPLGVLGEALLLALGAALLAGLQPARRAMRIPPALALREE